jgi:uncharacterized RDD family membrane protein YckC
MEETSLFHGEFDQIGKLWKRAIAYIADGFILAIPTIIIVLAYFFILGKGKFPNVAQFKQLENTKATILLEIILWAMALLYFTYFVGKTGQTPGKKSMGLMVVNSNGNIIGYKRAFLRYLFFVVYRLGNIGGVIFIIAFIMTVVDTQRRSLHDRICKTFVVGKEREESIEKVVQEGKPRIAGPAVFALFLSIFCIFIPIVGQVICFYVCGRVLYDIKQSKGLLKGKSLAIAGIIISTVILIGFIILFLLEMSRSR